MYSCQFTETIHINENGSGKMSFLLDGSQLMEMGGDDMMGEEEKVVDSTVVFKTFLEEKKDSIATLPKAEQERLKALENFKMHMVVDPKTKKMVVDMYSDFDNVEGLQDMFKLMNNANDLKDADDGKKSNPFEVLGSSEATKVEYSYNKNVFKRKVTVLDREQLNTLKDSIADAEMMLAASTYELNYHFPKRIKSVSLDAAKFSEDHKSFSVEVSFKEYMINPESLNVEVILED
ncbi:hypothetical protein [Formosa sp. S-31]|uniref:hypothetical protein n=1 Tax=Formosa sp. S-31 TaxID=2790949 RepID=UPI003EBE07F0